MTKYETLKEEYPEHVSLDQLCRICRINKQSALYLVQDGSIPCMDTGKKTWRYRIAIDDVITYLRRREQVGSMMPTGSVGSRHKRLNNPRKSFASYLLHGEEHEIAEYFKYIFADYPDVLTVTDISEMTGLSKKTILQYIGTGHIKTLCKHNKYLIPKPYLLEFVVSRRFIDYKSNSEAFKRILGDFELWKTAKL
ncbi:MAG: helix-turn-helix domain-containing protein [Oscillospiraceae bacterium]|jgi:hypothetical protein|nr:helix-turn-helix domain-containing protein [Oscillospiraceae bacterium]